MQPLFVKLSLRFALRAVGLKAPFPLFVDANGNIPLTESPSGSHVVVGQKRIELHRYSLHTGSYQRQQSFDSVDAFIRSFIDERIDLAATYYMVSKHSDTIKKMKQGDFREFLDVRGNFVEIFQKRLDGYLGGLTFMLMSRLAAM